MTREDLMREVSVPRLVEPQYYEEVRARLLALERLEERAVAAWFTGVHQHVCPRCHATIAHTGLEAVRDGDIKAHSCCGADVRKPSKES